MIMHHREYISHRECWVAREDSLSLSLSLCRFLGSRSSRDFICKRKITPRMKRSSNFFQFRLIEFNAFNAFRREIIRRYWRNIDAILSIFARRYWHGRPNPRNNPLSSDYLWWRHNVTWHRVTIELESVELLTRTRRIAEISRMVPAIWISPVRLNATDIQMPAPSIKSIKSATFIVI